jgi:hypothetical protein
MLSPASVLGHVEVMASLWVESKEKHHLPPLSTMGAWGVVHCSTELELINQRIKFMLLSPTSVRGNVCKLMCSHHPDIINSLLHQEKYVESDSAILPSKPGHGTTHIVLDFKLDLSPVELAFANCCATTQFRLDDFRAFNGCHGIDTSLAITLPRAMVNARRTNSSLRPGFCADTSRKALAKA